MPSCRLQQVGSGFEDLGHPLRLKRVYQSGGKGRIRAQKHVYKQPDFVIPNRAMSMRGGGIGSLFVPLFRYLAPVVSPLLSKGLSALKQELLSAGVDILQNPTKEMVKKRSRQVIDNLAEKAEKKIKLMTGSGVQKKKKCIKRSKWSKPKHSATSLRRVQKKKRKRSKKSKNLQLKKQKILVRGRAKRSKKNTNNVKDIFG